MYRYRSQLFINTKYEPSTKKVLTKWWLNVSREQSEHIFQVLFCSMPTSAALIPQFLWHPPVISAPANNFSQPPPPPLYRSFFKNSFRRPLYYEGPRIFPALRSPFLGTIFQASCPGDLGGYFSRPFDGGGGEGLEREGPREVIWLMRGLFPLVKGPNEWRGWRKTGGCYRVKIKVRSFNH